MPSKRAYRARIGVRWIEQMRGMETAGLATMVLPSGMTHDGTNTCMPEVAGSLAMRLRSQMKAL